MNIDQVVKVHKALGDRTRYKIIQILGKESNLCPAKLEDLLESIPYPRYHQHGHY